MMGVFIFPSVFSSGGPIFYLLLLLYHGMELNETFTESHCAPSILDFDPNQYGGQKILVIRLGSGGIRLGEWGYQVNEHCSQF